MFKWEWDYLKKHFIRTPRISVILITYLNHKPPYIEKSKSVKAAKCNISRHYKSVMGILLQNEAVKFLDEIC